VLIWITYKRTVPVRNYCWRARFPCNLFHCYWLFSMTAVADSENPFEICCDFVFKLLYSYKYLLDVHILKKAVSVLSVIVSLFCFIALLLLSVVTRILFILSPYQNIVENIYVRLFPMFCKWCWQKCRSTY